MHRRVSLSRPGPSHPLAISQDLDRFGRNLVSAKSCHSIAPRRGIRVTTPGTSLSKPAAN